MTISYDQRLTKPRDVLFQEVDGESVLLHIGKGHYFALDTMGHAMWTAVTTSATVQEAFDKLLAEYEVEPERLQADLTHLI